MSHGFTRRRKRWSLKRPPYRRSPAAALQINPHMKMKSLAMRLRCRNSTSKNSIRGWLTTKKTKTQQEKL